MGENCNMQNCPFINGGSVYSAARWKQNVEDKITAIEKEVMEMQNKDKEIVEKIDSIRRAIWVWVGVMTAGTLGYIAKFIVGIS